MLSLLLLAWRGCTRDGTPADAGVQAMSPPAAPATPTTPGAQAEAEAGIRATRQRRDASLRSAVSTVQRYLTALGEDQARADTFWAGGRPPPGTREADLRTLTELRALRIENGSPVALDSQAVPDAVEIPVELRISTRNAPLRHYQGWYRLRRAGDGWQITSAAIDASPPRR